MEAFRNVVSILIGAILVVGGILDECPRVAAIAVGLVLMGAFTVPEAFAAIRGESSPKEKNEQ